MGTTSRLIIAVAAVALTGCAGGAPIASRSAPVPASPSASASAAAAGGEAEVKAPRSGKIAQTDEFGVVVSAAGDPPVVEVDRVSMLDGAEARSAAAERGEEVTNDYFVVNDNRATRRYPLADDAVIWGDIGFGHAGDPQRVTVERWRAFLATPAAQSTLFHFDVEDGRIVAVEEQYRP